VVVSCLRPLGLERRPAGAALRVVPALDAVERPDGFTPAPAAI
jgi:hypothetical protein